ncbi:MAG TPA: hypothetical protein VFZ08_17060 [Terriglobia bacterium]|nr:hypothetical protein [Terriglobia bacterium]
MIEGPFIMVMVVCIASVAGLVAIIGIVFWHRTRLRELQAHEAMRIREMEHQRNLKQLELEIERVKAGRTPEAVV